MNTKTRMMKPNNLLTALAFFLFSFLLKGQVSVVNVQLMPYNVTPESMLSAAIMNNGEGQQVSMISKLYNFNNDLLLTVKSQNFFVKAGLNSALDNTRKVLAVEYASGNQSEYIKTSHGLPSGTFKLCIDIIQTQTTEVNDHYCDELESEFNQYLYLVSPADKDTLETTTPLLVWSHSEPFNVLSQGEYYRMLVTAITANQSAEEAIIINTPLMAKNYLTTHSLQYPYDAKVLEKGKRYAWQVQKMTNGVVTNKTEAWEFTIAADKLTKDNKYYALKKTLDAGYYLAENNKLFFKFDEEYTSTKLRCTIYDSKRQEVKPSAKNEGQKDVVLDFKQNGYNRYEINLDELAIGSGFYTLETQNEKGELFLLKFYVQ